MEQSGMGRRKIGLVLFNIAVALVIVGSLYDLLMPGVPANHLAYVGAADGRLDPRYAELDLAMLRSIGGCLLAIGVTALVLTNGPIRRGEGWARVTVVILVAVAEGNNAYRMYPFGSPWYGPFGFAVLAAVRAALTSPPEICSIDPLKGIRPDEAAHDPGGRRTGPLSHHAGR
jgi:hypothetical protein